VFYARINKIKVFNNREGFLWFNRRAEMRIYSYCLYPGTDGAGPPPATQGKGIISPLAMSDLLDLSGEAARRQKLADAVIAEAGYPAQSACLEINGVRDNQSLFFGDAGMVIFSGEDIPDGIDIRLWVIESDSDIRDFAVDADKIIDSDAFKGLFAAVETALTVTNPVLSGIIAVGGVVVNLLRQKLRANKDDLAGYWQTSLNRAEHYPHGVRDKQDVYDTTGNITVDYTLFGYDRAVNSEQIIVNSE
jgi:hypothetical protein